jgi:hypothetical protein
MPGRSFCQSSSETPPFWIGISIDAPVRLSVIVMLSVTVYRLLSDALFNPT